MTGRTHDLTAFTGLTLAFSYLPLIEMSLATFLVALAANFIGGLAPDLDQSTSKLWGNIRGGSIIARLIAPILGGHRMISHSLVGIFLTGFLLKQFLYLASTVVLVDMHIVWWAFMIGFLSHLFVDLFTKEGIPLLFPFPFEIGIPPIKALRIRTGGLIEKSLIFPGLMLINFYLVSQNYTKILDFFRDYIH